MSSVLSPAGQMLGTDAELRTFSYCLEILYMSKIHFEKLYSSFLLFKYIARVTTLSPSNFMNYFSVSHYSLSPIYKGMTISCRTISVILISANKNKNLQESLLQLGDGSIFH